MSIKKIKTLIIILALALALSLLAVAGVYICRLYSSENSKTVVSDNIITPDTNKISAIPTPLSIAYAAENDNSNLSLYSTKAEDNTPFQASNMFPGDNITKNFRLKVSHNGTVTVRYHADIRSGYEKLAQVLKIKIELQNKLLYDGIMRDMPEAVTCSLPAQSNITDELEYKITAYLDTSVGNEYQNQKLIADFRWWIDKDEQDNLSFPQTGQNILIWFFVGAAGISALLLIILLNNRRKGDSAYGK